jgi:hypothetical protein
VLFSFLFFTASKPALVTISLLPNSFGGLFSRNKDGGGGGGGGGRCGVVGDGVGDCGVGGGGGGGGGGGCNNTHNNNSNNNNSDKLPAIVGSFH